MYTFLITLHVFICVIMIGVVLLQSGKGAEIGASFGGSSQTVFGSRGPGTFLSKATAWAASIFMLTSLSLAILSKQAVTGSSVLDNLDSGVTSEQVEEGLPVDYQLIDETALTEGTVEPTPASEDPVPAIP
ncbi:MAG TPA: preprotein translocase subunit SecG [Nitrospirales bacterium]|nr:preprotein translocase subunit SecG [Nitrospirales bacterium]HIA14554.1 preprotein translocase subunit SecG [Nitrospirales bacterium]HIB53264.1 preprotein translocase subunit SecG [Nitrospirales bacterium]HIC04487.1 preprotein translocase subunit SecG [Nitrospirales bacterium]HIN33600.1 preprotein translocase subunit SecG [Nitrospirales bacterium]